MPSRLPATLWCDEANARGTVTWDDRRVTSLSEARYAHLGQLWSVTKYWSSQRKVTPHHYTALHSITQHYNVGRKRDRGSRTSTKRGMQRQPRRASTPYREGCGSNLEHYNRHCVNSMTMRSYTRSKHHTITLSHAACKDEFRKIYVYPSHRWDVLIFLFVANIKSPRATTDRGTVPNIASVNHCLSQPLHQSTIASVNHCLSQPFPQPLPQSTITSVNHCISQSLH